MSETITDTETAALVARMKEAAQKATPGPWHTKYTGISGYVYPEKGTWVCSTIIPVWAAIDGTGKQTDGARTAAR